MTKTKIVCTLGPASMDKTTIKRLVKEGMDVARLNFSHTSCRKGLEIIGLLKEIRDEMNIPLAILLDTKGPEVRIYGYDAIIPLKKNDIIIIESRLSEDIEEYKSSGEKHFFTNLPSLAALTQIGKKVLLMDGFIQCEIIEKNKKKQSIRAKVLNPGKLRPKAHLTLPKVDYPLPFISNKDKQDIIFAVENELEYLALSFVKNAEEIFQVKNMILDTNPDSQIKIISKIENKKSVDNMDEIIAHSDGIMVARGDLGVEMDIEAVPIIQKILIKNCYLSGKPVITATQMLESMIENPIPTRAEASDVANACYDQTSAVMLSGETAIGRSPDLVVKTMSRILLKAEKSIDYEDFLSMRKNMTNSEDLTTIVTYNALSAAYQSNARAIVVVTRSGYSARMLSRLRPGLPLYAFTYEKNVYHQLALNWGIYPFLIHKEESFETLTRKVKLYCEENELAQKGDHIVFVAGLPMGVKGSTNMIRIETIGRTRT